LGIINLDAPFSGIAVQVVADAAASLLADGHGVAVLEG